MKKFFKKSIITILVLITIITSTSTTFGAFQIGEVNSMYTTNSADLKIIEEGKNPGLGLHELHEEGYTGKGVNVAYIDQPLDQNHEEFKGLDLHYYTINGVSNYQKSFHGSSVLSILARQTIK